IAETVLGLPPQFTQNQRAARRYQRPPRAEPGRALSQLRIARASGVAEDSPLAFGNRQLHGFGLRIEQDQPPRPFIAPGAVFDQESDATFRDWQSELIVEELQRAPRFVRSLQAEERVGAPQFDQSAIVFDHVVLFGLFAPADHIHRIGFVVAVVVAAFGPQEFLAALDERNALRGEDDRRRELVHGATVGGGDRGVFGGADQQTIPQRVIVVALDVVDGFERRVGEIVYSAADALLDLIDAEAGLDEAGGAGVEDVAFEGVAEMVVEDRPPAATLRPLAVDFNRRRAARPGFAVDQQIRINGPQLADDLP